MTTVKIETHAEPATTLDKMFGDATPEGAKLENGEVVTESTKKSDDGDEEEEDQDQDQDKKGE